MRSRASSPPSSVASAADHAAELFRRGIEEDRTAEAFDGAWLTLNSVDQIAEAWAESSPDEPLSAGVANPDAVCMGVVEGDGALRYGDARLKALMGAPADSPACRALIRRALKDGRAIGLVETLDDGVVACCAVTPAAAPRLQLSPKAKAALAAGSGGLLLLVFAPSRSRGLVRQAAEAFGLTDVETRVVQALMDAPSLEQAADDIGVSRDAARVALANAMRKTGVERSSQLIGRVVDLSCGALAEPSATGGDLGESLGLSGAETRVAHALAGGATAAEAARALGMSPQTVQSYRKSVFAKTGVRRTRDLRRLMTEADELNRLSSAEELAFHPPPDSGALRIVIGAGGRRVALTDYGPLGRTPVMVGHGVATGGKVPPPLLARLKRAGYRPIALQRPGFGLTEPAAGDYLQTTVDDLAGVLDALRQPSAHLLAREGGGAAALAFGIAHPDRVGRGVLLNPRSPLAASVSGLTLGDRMSRGLMQRPLLIRGFAEIMRRQSRADLLERILRQVYAGMSVDRDAVADPELMRYLVQDIQSLTARTTAGSVAEHQLYAHGWRIPDGLDLDRWTVGYSSELYTDEDLQPWRDAFGSRVRAIDGAGLLAQFTHPEEVAALLDG